MDDNEFNALCDAHGFSAVARNDFPLVSRNMFKAFADAVVVAERERSAWQPIETAPRDGTAVLVGRVYEDGKVEYAVACNYNDGLGWSDMGALTHWQPLPSPPPITP